MNDNPGGKMITVRSTNHWDKWCEKMWAKAEGAWIGREGQDHAYREFVVVPALAKALRAHGERTLVDLGSGDGVMDGQLLTAMSFDAPMHLVLVDRSKTQLDLAKERLQRHRVNLSTLCADLGNIKPDVAHALTSIRGLASGRMSWMSVFVMHELPNLGRFLGSVSGMMKRGEQLHSVVVAHWFAEKLRKTKRAFVEGVGADGDDFVTAMRYPIGTGDGEVFYVPLFQRRAIDYRTIGRRHGLTLTSVEELTVPRTQYTEHIFLPTVYGEDILKYPSSLLLTFEKR